jgi:hypothetical protein
VTKNNSFALDNAFRNLIHSLSARGGRLLAIKFIYRGKTWYADTAREAIELRRELEKQDIAEETFPSLYLSSQDETLWSADRIADLLDGVGTLQRDFLEILVNCPSIEANALAEKLGLDSQIALAGVLSGLAKQVRAMDLLPETLYRVNTRWDGKSKVRSFSIMPGFRMGAKDSGLLPARKENHAPATKAKRK